MILNQVKLFALFCLVSSATAIVVKDSPGNPSPRPSPRISDTHILRRHNDLKISSSSDTSSSSVPIPTQTSTVPVPRANKIRRYDEPTPDEIHRIMRREGEQPNDEGPPDDEDGEPDDQE